MAILEAVHYFTTITIFLILSLILYLRFTTANVKLSAGQHFSWDVNCAVVNCSVLTLVLYSGVIFFINWPTVCVLRLPQGWRVHSYLLATSVNRHLKSSRHCQEFTYRHFQQSNTTISVAVAKRPRDCCVGQFWPNVTERWYFDVKNTATLSEVQLVGC